MLLSSIEPKGEDEIILIVFQCLKILEMIGEKMENSEKFRENSVQVQSRFERFALSLGIKLASH